MKKLILFSVLFSCFRLSAQESLTYPQLAEKTTEINLRDSLYLTNLDGMMPLDTFTVKRWFTPALSGSETVKLKNKEFYLAGKITTNEHFDLHILIEDKKKTDGSGLQIVHLVTTKKDGAYIASLKAAVTGTKKKSNYYTSSWLYKGLNIIQDSKITTSTSSLANISQYKINNTGRFVMYSN